MKDVYQNVIAKVQINVKKNEEKVKVKKGYDQRNKNK